VLGATVSGNDLGDVAATVVTGSAPRHCCRCQGQLAVPLGRCCRCQGWQCPWGALLSLPRLPRGWCRSSAATTASTPRDTCQS